MSDKEPVQADGQGTKKRSGAPDVESRPGGSGESGGGAYPNPHTDHDAGNDDLEGFDGHGGQSQIAYEGGKNPNATSKGG